MTVSWWRRRPVVVALVAVLAIAVAVVIVSRVGGQGSTSSAASVPPVPGATGPVTPLPARTTAVPAPTPGTIDETVAPGKPGATVSGDLDRPLELEGNVEVSLLGITATEVQAVGPGDPSGPALAVKVRLDNRSKQAMDVDGAQVSLLYQGGEEIAVPTPGGASPFVGQLEASKSVEGTYVFSIPKTTQKSVTVLVTYAAGAPVAKFDGAVK